MSHIERRIEYLQKHKIIYRRDPINDKPTATYFWGNFYKEGTYECYELFRSKARITTYKSLVWHLYVIWYLNPKMDQDLFKTIGTFIANKSNGFITFDISESLLEKMLYDVSLMDLEKPPPNKLRKVIFKDGSGLTVEQKLSIVGQMVGKTKISESEIYDAMLMLVDKNIKITAKALASKLKCSTRTIYRNMGNELKREKELLNQRYEKI